jgi:hypothetical protein
VPRFILYLLLCSVSFIMFSSSSFAACVSRYVGTLFIGLYLICYVHMGARSHSLIGYLFVYVFYILRILALSSYGVLLNPGNQWSYVVLF